VGVAQPTRHGAGRIDRLRHPAEVPLFVFMVALNVVIIALIVRAAVVLPYVPERLHDSALAVVIRSALIGLLLLVPGLIVVREVGRAQVRGTAVQLSPHQYPWLYQVAEEFAARLKLRRRPEIFLANGNGTLNAFASQATGYDYVVLSNELFANLYNNNRAGLRFILGHEMGHIRLHHVSLWYQIAVAYSQLIPLLGPTLSRLREYSCDRHGASLSPGGATGLVLLASGRYTENDVDVTELVRQGRMLQGFWVELAQLPRSHPFTVRRLERLFGIGMFQPVARPVQADPRDQPHWAWFSKPTPYARTADRDGNRRAGPGNPSGRGG
jgi:Zn-dependent protease with chaperone function